MDPIRTKPNDGSIISKEGIVDPEYQRFFDDTEEILNQTVAGPTIRFPAYTAGNLPPPSENLRGIAFGEGVGTAFLTPVFVATPLAFPSFTITSVTDASGIAQFNFTTGPASPLAIGEEVIISGYTDPTRLIYNGTHQVTFPDSNLFRISSIPFAGSETNRTFQVGSAWRNIFNNVIVS